MSKAIQVHITTPSTTGEINMVTWLDVLLKPIKGMVIETKGDRRHWTVYAAYSIPSEIDGLAKWTEVSRA